MNYYYKKLVEELKRDVNLFKPVGADSDYDAEQLSKGTEVEMEHTTQKDIAKIITKHHLDEFENYYIALEEMENKLKGIERETASGNTTGKPFGEPKSDEERKVQHKKLYGTDELPPRGTGLRSEK